MKNVVFAVRGIPQSLAGKLDRVVWDMAQPPEHHTVVSKSEQITHTHTWTEVRIGDGDLRGGERRAD